MALFTVNMTICFLQKRLRLVSVLGAGLLVGTALAVIIPEGVHALYEGHHGHDHEHSKLWRCAYC